MHCLFSCQPVAKQYPIEWGMDSTLISKQIWWHRARRFSKYSLARLPIFFFFLVFFSIRPHIWFRRKICPNLLARRTVLLAPGRGICRALRHNFWTVQQIYLDTTKVHITCCNASPLLTKWRAMPVPPPGPLGSDFEGSGVVRNTSWGLNSPWNLGIRPQQTKKYSQEN